MALNFLWSIRGTLMTWPQPSFTWFWMRMPPGPWQRSTAAIDSFKDMVWKRLISHSTEIRSCSKPDTCGYASSKAGTSWWNVRVMVPDQAVCSTCHGHGGDSMYAHDVPGRVLFPVKCLFPFHFRRVFQKTIASSNDPSSHPFLAKSIDTSEKLIIQMCNEALYS